MRIALISDKYPPDPGGLAISVRRLARLLVAAGHEVEIFAPAPLDEPLTAPVGETDAFRVHRLAALPRAGDTFADWFGLLVDAQRAHAFHIFHAFFATSLAFVTVYAARVLGVPSIVSVRGNDLDRAVFDPARAAHVLYAVQEASAVTANSRDLVTKAQALAPKQAVTLVPNGVDVDLFRPSPPDPALAQRLDLGGYSVLGFSGEARSKKGLGLLLLAFREVARTRPVVLVLAGGVRRDAREMFSLFQKQNPELRIVPVPYVDQPQLPAYYNLMDVLAMPSQKDGLPNALLEGMACARAIVATPAGGIPDAIRHEENGLLVPFGDVPALSEAIRSLIDDPARRRRLGENARETVAHAFTPAQELALNLALYERLRH